MTLNEKMNSVYSNLSKGGSLSRLELINCGLSSTNITRLVRDGVLVSEGYMRGMYGLRNVDRLFEYGVALENKGDFFGAMNCFTKCLDYDKHHEGANFRLFAICVDNGSIERAVKHLESIYTNESVDKRRYNIYLVLLNRFYELPGHLKNVVENCSLDKCLLGDGDEERDIYYKEIVAGIMMGDYKTVESLVESSQCGDPFIDNLLIKLMKMSEMAKTAKESKESSARRVRMEPGKSIDDVLERLKAHEIPSARATVHNYLESISKLEYENIVLKMIEVSTLEKDSTFYEPIKALCDIARGEFSFDVKSYVEVFEGVLKEKKFKLAKACLELITLSGCIDEEALKRLVDKFKRKAITSRRNDIIDLDGYYGVEGIQRMIWSIESGVSVEETFQVFEASSEQRCTIMLILAKEAYASGMFKLGDKYMQYVERSEKTPEVLMFFNYLRKNKKLLVNREGDKNIPYVILPNK